MTENKIAVFWFRRDLRLIDNTGLYHALKSGMPVLPLFIFDREILDQLEDRDDLRVNFIHQQLTSLDRSLRKLGSGMLVRYGSPVEIWKALCEEYPLGAVYLNHDYEPYATMRDDQIRELVWTLSGAGFHTYKDQVIFEKQEVLTAQNKVYTVFTPFSKRWKANLTPDHLKSWPMEEVQDGYLKLDASAMTIPTLASMGFEAVDYAYPSLKVANEIIEQYNENRDFPAIRGTTRLSVHLRFGTISIRKLVRSAQLLSTSWLNELIWREFYMQILWNFPHVVTDAFKPAYDKIPWRDAPEDFERWCAGKTGYPMVDAGMRELAATGFMHNRVRMVTASFLCKHLLIDWRWGERWFARKLLDFELSSNNGGWQWAAGSGTDAAPYFRIFNPESQLKKFDSKGEYIRRWVPEYGTPDYVRPMVEHKFARERCLEVYKKALKGE